MKRIAKPSPVIRSTPRRHAERAHCSPEDPGPARKKLLFALLFIVLLAGTFAIQLLAHAESPSLRPAQRTFHRLPDRYAKSIQPFHSSCDRDRDGIDDQTDILQGALRYLSTNPRYQSRNYPTGYPDDACGICTDVIAFALRDAGYDLLSLMREDIRSSPSSYPFATPGSSIDFRRVQNQHAFLARVTPSLKHWIFTNLTLGRAAISSSLKAISASCPITATPAASLISCTTLPPISPITKKTCLKSATTSSGIIG